MSVFNRMNVFRWSVAVMFLGIVCAWAVHGLAGELLIVVGAAGVLYSLMRVVETDTSGRQEETDTRNDAVRRHHSGAT